MVSERGYARRQSFRKRARCKSQDGPLRNMTIEEQFADWLANQKYLRDAHTIDSYLENLPQAAKESFRQIEVTRDDQISVGVEAANVVSWGMPVMADLTSREWGLVIISCVGQVAVGWLYVAQLWAQAETFDKPVSKIITFLRGDTLAWWRDEGDVAVGANASFLTFKDAFYKRFVKPSDSLKARADLQKCKQADLTIFCIEVPWIAKQGCCRSSS